jgi:hypothetical protein
MSKQQLTAGGIAVLIAPPTDSTKVTTRVRHWTLARLLQPDALHTGAGRHRKYDLIAVLDAALLNVLAEPASISLGARGRSYVRFHWCGPRSGIGFMTGRWGFSWN